MSGASEKHREAARRVQNEMADKQVSDGCWNFDDGDLIIAAALAAAEREGMKRAEVICYARSKDSRQQAKQYESNGDEVSQTQCLIAAVEAIDCASAISRAEGGK